MYLKHRTSEHIVLTWYALYLQRITRENYGIRDRSVIVQAILAFMDVFEDALESPEIPLMKLDADLLVLNELADALSKSSKQSVKVVDLFHPVGIHVRGS